MNGFAGIWTKVKFKMGSTPSLRNTKIAINYMSQKTAMQVAKNAINLKAISLHIPSVAEIVSTTSHVCLYTFDASTQQWEKLGIEGTLFLFTTNERRGWIVLNRLALDNYIEWLELVADVGCSGEYIMYQCEHRVIGIWVFGEKERLDLVNGMSNWVRQRNIRSDQAEFTAANPLIRLNASNDNIPQQREGNGFSMSLDDIWLALNSMHPATSSYLSEIDFIDRLGMLIQVFFS